MSWGKLGCPWQVLAPKHVGDCVAQSIIREYHTSYRGSHHWNLRNHDTGCWAIQYLSVRPLHEVTEPRDLRNLRNLLWVVPRTMDSRLETFWWQSSQSEVQCPGSATMTYILLGWDPCHQEPILGLITKWGIIRELRLRAIQFRRSCSRETSGT